MTEKHEVVFYPCLNGRHGECSGETKGSRCSCYCHRKEARGTR